MTVSYIDLSEAGTRGPSFVDPDTLVAYVDTLRSRPPFMFELDSEKGYELMVGLAGEIGFAQFSQSGTGGPFFMTVDPHANTIQLSTTTSLQAVLIRQLTISTVSLTTGYVKCCCTLPRRVNEVQLLSGR